LFGYDKKIVNELYVDFNDTNKLSTYILAEESQELCCGRYFAYAFEENEELIYAEWLLPMKLKRAEDNSVIDTAVKYDAHEQMKIHGTSPALTYYSPHNELVTLAHIHRPGDRRTSEYALHGHHYTHVFIAYVGERAFRTPAGATTGYIRITRFVLCRSVATRRTVCVEAKRAVIVLIANSLHQQQQVRC